MGLEVRTPFGSPVAWADVFSRQAETERCCLMLSCRQLGRVTPLPAEDYVLCVLANGISGRRPSQLAVAAFLDSFLSSDEQDVLWRLRDAVKAADGRLAACSEPDRRSTLTAVFVACDGTAYGVSMGDSPLVVGAPELETPVGVKKLGHERSTAVGAGQTLLDTPQAGWIEQWWPAGGGDCSRLAPGTSLLLLDRGATDSPVDATGIGLRFRGGQVTPSRLVAQAGWLVSATGWGCGPGRQLEFGVACLVEERARGAVAGLMRSVLEVDPGGLWLEQSSAEAGREADQTRLAAVARGPDGVRATFASGGASVQATVGFGATGSEGAALTLRLGSEADALDRGVVVAIEERTTAGWPLPGPGPRGRRWVPLLGPLWRRWRGG